MHASIHTCSTKETAEKRTHVMNTIDSSRVQQIKAKIHEYSNKLADKCSGSSSSRFTHIHMAHIHMAHIHMSHIHMSHIHMAHIHMAHIHISHIHISHIQ